MSPTPKDAPLDVPEAGDRILASFPRISTDDLGFENLPHKAPLLAGSLLSLLGLKKRGKLGLFLAGIGAGLVVQGAKQNGLTDGGWKRHLFHTRPEKLVPFQRRIIIDRPVSDVFRFWTNEENLAVFLPHVRDIAPLDKTRSRWELRLNDSLSFHWVAEVIAREPDELLVWRVQEPSDLYHEGWVRFAPLRGGMSTIMTIKLYLLAPGGGIGAKILEMLERLPIRLFSEDLERFRTIMESSNLDPSADTKTLH